jgi:hypothetical protein
VKSKVIDSDRNAQRSQFVGQFPVLIDRQADVLGGLHVFEAFVHRLVLAVEQPLDRFGCAIGLDSVSSFLFLVAANSIEL